MGGLKFRSLQDLCFLNICSQSVALSEKWMVAPKFADGIRLYCFILATPCVTFLGLSCKNTHTEHGAIVGRERLWGQWPHASIWVWWSTYHTNTVRLDKGKYCCYFFLHIFCFLFRTIFLSQLFRSNWGCFSTVNYSWMNGLQS